MHPNYCLLNSIDEHHFCYHCDSCYCKKVAEYHEPTDEDIEKGFEAKLLEKDEYEPSDADIEAEIEKQIAKAETMADNL